MKDSKVKIIRKATESDAPAIRNLCNIGLGYDYPLEKLSAHLKALLDHSDHLILVAEIQGKVVGFLQATTRLLLYYDPLIDILGIAVSPSHKRQGIGQKLLSAAEAWGSESGAAGVRLGSGVARAGAHQFYLSCGYEQSGQQLKFLKLF